MASPVNAALCALLATAFWSLLGYALTRHLLPRALAIGAAPVTGWAAHSAATLPISFLIGFSPFTVVAVGALCAAVSVATLKLAAKGDAEAAPAMPWWAYVAAAVLALVPAVAILPKIAPGAVHLADPIFDHAKIAMIDAMTRQGLPPTDPVFGAAGPHGQVFYYYLWHYSAAALALPLHVSGWEADIGLTWFTALASLSLLMGLAVWLSKRSAAAIWVVALAAAASLRGVLSWIFGSYSLEPFLAQPTGFAGWLFQAAWAPQHLMSASCVMMAMLLIARYAQRQSVLLLVTLALMVVAGFESSTYVGGVTFAIAALAAAPLLFVGIEPARRLRFFAGMAVAAVLAVCLAAPFLNNQLMAVAARGGDSPIVFRHFVVLGAMFPAALRHVLDWPAYWLVLLPIELPATYVAGVMALIVMSRSSAPRPEKLATAALACLAAAGLLASWLLASTLGDNNDLGLRAVLPAASVLIATAAAGLMLLPRRAVIAATALGGLILSLPDTAVMIRSNVDGTPTPDGSVFAQAPELWQAVRRYAAPTARVANNPLFLQDLTPWPANISWALLANRSSCFAGRELALALAPLSEGMREAINAQFVRVFAGEGTAADLSDLARKYGCDVVVVVPQDKAWTNDPFAASPDYRLAENRDGRWRIYVAVKADPAAR
ncbi:MAG TPA: hypothetical protein VK749_09545 [Xanthobacteraceae bacterium]|jgi:hypothetical protein|nr:hypothetical protein [Xanthobacteraceae bacterium]